MRLVAFWQLSTNEYGDADDDEQWAPNQSDMVRYCTNADGPHTLQAKLHYI